MITLLVHSVNYFVLPSKVSHFNWKLGKTMREKNMFLAHIHTQCRTHWNNSVATQLQGNIMLFAVYICIMLSCLCVFTTGSFSVSLFIMGGGIQTYTNTNPFSSAECLS